jgi:hypothetical protein
MSHLRKHREVVSAIESPRDATRSTVPVSGIQRVELRRFDVTRTIVLLAMAGGIYALLHDLGTRLGKVGGI